MPKVILLWFAASLVPALCQTSGSGIESIRVGMSEEAVDVALKQPDVIKHTAPRDKTMDIWTYRFGGNESSDIPERQGRGHQCSYERLPW